MPPGSAAASIRAARFHLGADDRVIHAVFRAEIADIAITGIDTDPHLEGLLERAGVRRREGFRASRCCGVSAKCYSPE